MNAYGDLAAGQPPRRVVEGSGKADIDHVNIWMRSQPWYQQIVQQYGGHADSDEAKQAVMRAAQAHGVQVDEGRFEIDDTGNIHGKGHLLRNILIVGGIAAAAIATMGAAGVFAGAGVPGAAGTVGAAGSTAAGAGVGIGETAATVGLAGPVAGLGVTAAPIVHAAATSAPSWLGPVLQAGIPAAGTVIGSTLAAKANTHATDVQAELTREALEYEKQRDLYHSTTEGNRYAAMMNAEQPYIDEGRSSASRSAELMGLPAISPSRDLGPPPTYVNPGMPGMNPLPTSPNDPRRQIPGFDPRTGIVTPTSPGPPTAGGMPSPPDVGQGQTVMMRAPDGSVRPVPAAQATHYEQRGATRVA